MRKPSKTALFAAVTTWDAPRVRALLTAAPELLAAVDPRGRAALHLACSVKPGKAGTHEPNGIRTVTTLLECGADVHGYVPLENGTFKATPAWYAVAHGDNLPLVRMLLKRGADVSNCLYAATWNDNAAMLREILATNPPMDDVADGEPVLISAIRWRKMKALDVLIQAGACAFVPDGKGRDAVFHARRKKLPERLVERLERLRPVGT
jgi:ankyrin repeat protein